MDECKMEIVNMKMSKFFILEYQKYGISAKRATGETLMNTKD